MKDITSLKNQEFHLEELVKAVRELLQQGAPPPRDGRVAEYPDVRTMRYYQSIGALDKPFRYDGRMAMYGYRHLVQVLAIKVLQSQGYSLAQIQKALLTTSPAALEAQVEGIFEGWKGGEVQGQVVAFDRSELPAEERTPGLLGVNREGADSDQPALRRGGELIAVEIRPGLTVMIDPNQVERPDQMIEKIRNLLTEGKAK